MYTFYDETIDAITESAHKVDDILWVGFQSGRVGFDIPSFLEEIKDRKAYPMDILNCDFVIMFSDASYLYRKETYSDAKDVEDDVYTMGYWKFYSAIKEPINKITDSIKISKMLDQALVYEKQDDEKN